MAKKHKEEEEKEEGKKSKGSSLDAKLRSEVGAVIGVEAPVREFISTGNLALDWAVSGRFIGGGLPIGRVVEFFGDPSTGKSLIIMHTLANIQKTGGIAILDDAEQAYDQFFADRIGVNTEELYLLDSETVEEHFKKVEKCISIIREDDKECLVGIALDSLAILSTKHEKESAFEKVDMTKPKLIRQGMRVMGGRFSKERILYIVANQTIANIGMYVAKKTTPGGGGVPFQASVRVELEKKQMLPDKNENIIGVTVEAYVVKNKVSPPFKKVRLKVYFGSGVDLFSGMLDVLVQCGYVEEKTGWYTYKDRKCRAQELEENMVEILKEIQDNPIPIPTSTEIIQPTDAQEEK